LIGGERVGGILAAGGAGVRAGVAKQWATLGGETVLRRAARVLAESGVVDEIVAVVPAGEESRGEADLQGLSVPVRAVAGGATRADSVRAGLDALGEIALVVVHDAARPFATAELTRAVAEAAAIGLPHEIKGQAIHAFVLLRHGHSPSKELEEELRQHVGHEMGPIAKPEDIKFLDKLPKTRSGKIMRRVLKARAQGLPEGDISTLEE